MNIKGPLGGKGSDEDWEVTRESTVNVSGTSRITVIIEQLEPFTRGWYDHLQASYDDPEACNRVRLEFGERLLESMNDGLSINSLRNVLDAFQEEYNRRLHVIDAARGLK